MLVGTAYRNYVYSHKLSDYGLADIHPNIFAVVVASFLFMGYSKQKSFLEEAKIILWVTVGFIVYEFIQMTPIIGVFDIKDILGSLIGCAASVLIHKIVNRKRS